MWLKGTFPTWVVVPSGTGTDRAPLAALPRAGRARPPRRGVTTRARAAGGRGGRGGRMGSDSPTPGPWPSCRHRQSPPLPDSPSGIFNYCKRREAAAPHLVSCGARGPGLRRGVLPRHPLSLGCHRSAQPPGTGRRAGHSRRPAARSPVKSVCNVVHQVGPVRARRPALPEGTGWGAGWGCAAPACCRPVNR